MTKAIRLCPNISAKSGYRTKIEYVVSGEILSGVATDVTADGLLEVDGERLLSSGDVRIKLKNEIGDNI